MAKNESNSTLAARERRAEEFADCDLAEQRQYTVRRNIEALCLVIKTVGLFQIDSKELDPEKKEAQKFSEQLKGKLKEMIGLIKA